MEKRKNDEAPHRGSMTYVVVVWAMVLIGIVILGPTMCIGIPLESGVGSLSR